MSKIKPIIPVPPEELYKRLGNKTPHEFLLTSFASLNLLTKYGNLQPTDQVLDIGCGVGRTAIALSTYLDSGTYCGIDIVPEFIQWCESNITPKFPNFKFTLADIYHPVYAPKGTHKTHDYDLPYPKNSFDFIFLLSTISELPPKSMRHLIKEASHLLKKNGRLFVTTFLLNQDSLNRIAAKQNQKDRGFAYDSNLDCYVTSHAYEEAIFGYDESSFSQVLNDAKLSIQKTIYGFWSGRKSGFSEDIVIATHH